MLVCDLVCIMVFFIVVDSYKFEFKSFTLTL